MATLTLQDAEALADKRRPWTFRMANGYTEWLATGRAKDEPAEIHDPAFAAIQVVDWAEVERQATANLAAGFTYKWTQFVRVSPATLAAHQPKPATHICLVGKDFWLADGSTKIRQLTVAEAQDLVQNQGVSISW